MISGKCFNKLISVFIKQVIRFFWSPNLPFIFLQNSGEKLSTLYLNKIFRVIPAARESPHQNARFLPHSPVGVLFSPMVSGCLGGGKKFVREKVHQEVDTWQGHWLWIAGVQCHGVTLI